MIRNILFTSALLLSAQGVFAGEARDTFDRFMGGLKTYQAAFQQSVLDTENSRTGLFHGVFYLDKPGRFRWTYISPNPQIIIADGSDVWLIEDDLEQAYVKPQSWALSGTPAEIFISDKPLDESFEVIEIGKRLDMQWLELIPRDQDSDVVRILLAFIDDDLMRLELSDKFGQISRFTFSKTERNPELANELFVYEPPSNFDIFAEEE